MFQHAHGDDPIIATREVAVILQAEVDLIGQPGLLGAGRSRGVLILGQGDPGDMRAIITGQRQRHSTPSTADIENAHPRFNSQLGGDMVLLGLLRLFQCHFGFTKIGAGILSVVIQEKGVEIVTQIVMVRHVGAGFARVVGLHDASDGKAGTVSGGDDRRHDRPPAIDCEQG